MLISEVKYFNGLHSGLHSVVVFNYLCSNSETETVAVWRDTMMRCNMETDRPKKWKTVDSQKCNNMNSYEINSTDRVNTIQMQ